MKKLLILITAFIVSAGVYAQDSTHHKMDKTMDKSMKKDCIMMKDGKLMVMKNGQTSEMKNEMTLSNGSTVMTDGTIKTKDGKTMMLKEGECVYMDGKIKPMKMKDKSPQ